MHSFVGSLVHTHTHTEDSALSRCQDAVTLTNAAPRSGRSQFARASAKDQRNAQQAKIQSKAPKLSSFPPSFSLPMLGSAAALRACGMVLKLVIVHNGQMNISSECWHFQAFSGQNMPTSFPMVRDMLSAVTPNFIRERSRNLVGMCRPEHANAPPTQP